MADLHRKPSLVISNQRNETHENNNQHYLFGVGTFRAHLL